MQVRKPYAVFAKRLSNYFLVELPSPHCCLVAVECCHAMYKLLLMLSGDVETNLAPHLTKIFNQLKNIANDIRAIKEERLADIDKRLDAPSRLETDLARCQKEVTSMHRRLEKRVDELENRTRRSNLVLYGLPEGKDETSETLKKIVNEGILKDTLEFEPVEIE